MNIFTLKKSWVAPVIVLVLCMTAFSMMLPVMAAAQTTAAETAPTNGTSCSSWMSFFWNFPTCGGRAVAEWSGAIIISIAGWILGIAGVLFNASLELTTIGFDSYIYANVQGGIESVWTVFRDIANIVIIGIFTFIALSMILGIEKFGAKKQVASVLIIAVLINFSLLFTRVIISSSNFLATQFYKAAQFNSEGAVSGAAASANAPYNQFSAGISGKFGQMLGVAGVFDSKEALQKVSESSNNGWMALLQGLLSAIIFLAVALLFLYASFLLIARAILFIFLLITSSLAFAAYLIPGGGFGGYGWSAWWGALLKNAIFGPLLLLLLWATIQVGQGVKATSGSIGGLLADPAKGGNINALFSYLLVLGMLYVSIKIASSFSHKIGGFNYAALAPALGAGLLGRMGGFMGRQTLGRAGANIGGRFAQRAKAADAGSTAQKLYNFGAQGFGSVAKRDFNLMRTQLGSEIQGVAKVKNLDAIAGKALGGFQGVQDTFKKQMIDTSKRLAYSDEEKKAQTKKEMEAVMKADPTQKAKYDQAEKEHADAKAALDEARKDATLAQGHIETRYKSRIEAAEQALSSAEKDYAADPTKKGAADAARGALRRLQREQKSEMSVQNERIRHATNKIKRAEQQFQDVSEEIGAVAIAAGKLPEKFASAGEIAEKSVKNSYTAMLRATSPTPEGVGKFAEKIGKEAGKPKENKRETLDIIRKAAREKLHDEEKKKP